MVQRVTYKIGDEELILETGKICKQANGCVYAQFSGTAVIATVCASGTVTEGMDYVPDRLLPLVRREKRPSTQSCPRVRRPDRRDRESENHSSFPSYTVAASKLWSIIKQLRFIS